MPSDKGMGLQATILLSPKEKGFQNSQGQCSQKAGGGDTAGGQSCR